MFRPDNAVLRFFAAAVLVFGIGTAYADAPQPKMEVTPMTFDFGVIKEGVKSKATYKIKNTGAADLIIYDVRPTCGCTVANLSSKKIAPGEMATLDAVYDSHNASGIVHRFINVRTNDPANQNISLGLSANVTPVPAPDLALSTWNSMNLQIPPGGSTDISVTVSNPGQEELTISQVITSQGASVKLGDTQVASGQQGNVDIKLKPGETRKMEIKVSPQIKSGNFQEVVTIRSNAKRHPYATFMAQGLVQ